MPNTPPLPNADSFSDLCQDDKNSLLDYISDNLKMTKTMNYKQSAYGLKSRYNRITGANKSHHITSQCFMEAMIASGYKADVEVGCAVPNWCFNVAKTNFTD